MIYSGEISALITAFLWSATAVLFEKSAKKVGSAVVNMTRLIIAFFLLSITILIAGLDLSISADQIFFLSLSGITGLVFGDGFLFKALQYVGARISMIVMSFSPALASILAYFFLGEEITILGLLGMAITLAGIISVATENRQKDEGINRSIEKRGLLYALFGALGQAVGLIFAKEAFSLGDMNGFVATIFRISAASIFLVPVYFIRKNNPNPVAVLRQNIPTIKFLFAGSVAGPYLGITFSLLAVAYTQVGIAATIMATVPVIMLPISRYYMKETLSARAIVGAITTVIGVGFLFLK